MAKAWYLVAYDVREPRRLRQTAKHLEGYGTRIQYSLFRCKLRQREMERLQWELTRILEPEDDLLIIGLCGDCARQIRCRTGKDDWTVKEASFQIV